MLRLSCHDAAMDESGSSVIYCRVVCVIIQKGKNMRTVEFESEVLAFVRIHHTIMLKQLISLYYELYKKYYDIEESPDNVGMIYARIRDSIKELANNGKIIVSQGLCSCVNQNLTIKDIIQGNYRIIMTRKQQIAVWYHIEKYQDIGTNAFVPPNLSDYETFLYWKNQHNCQCFSVVALETQFTSTDPILGKPIINENEILEKNKRIIKRYNDFIEYEQNQRKRKEFLPGLKDIQSVYLIDNNMWFQKLKNKGELDKKQDKDNWLKRNVNCLGVFSFDNLYKKIIVPSFVYYDFS